MKEKLKNLINLYIENYKVNQDEIKWKEAIVKIASASDKEFEKLKNEVVPNHFMPSELLNNGKSVIVYFLPFDEEIAISNIEGRISSKLWARAYIETNELILKINDMLVDYFVNEGYDAVSTKATHNFDEKTLMSRWSHRHIAVIAGMGTFGINNMFITDKGCAGRIGSIVVSKEMKYDIKINEEYCLYKKDKSCDKCVKRCITGALTVNEFDRELCYQMCLANDNYHKMENITDVCGKCVVDLPCSFVNPTKIYKKI